VLPGINKREATVRQVDFNPRVLSMTRANLSLV
jgi:hypothetical protein